MKVDTVSIKASVATYILQRKCVNSITSNVNMKKTNALTDILNHVGENGCKRGDHCGFMHVTLALKENQFKCVGCKNTWKDRYIEIM